MMKKIIKSKVDESGKEPLGQSPLRDKHYRGLRRKHFARLSLTYIAPLALLIAFFIYQYIQIIEESQRRHMISVAESQARILDIFIRERVSNLINLIDGPMMVTEPDNEGMDYFLSQLRRDSESFIDLGFFDSSGVQQSYAGSLKFLEKRDYSLQSWFIKLLDNEQRFVVTDIYLGLRNDPHFTIAVRRSYKGKVWIFKSSLDPGKIYESITSFEKSHDVTITIINSTGEFQLIQKLTDSLLGKSPYLPPDDKSKGFIETDSGKEIIKYAYSWLAGVQWAVVVSEKESEWAGFGEDRAITLISVSMFVMLLLLIIIFYRSKKVVEIEYEKDVAKLQLERAAKLATIGELASGIAHEIGNPLNIIATEVGLMQDYANPKFGIDKKVSELTDHFNTIMKAVFRCKDINYKLLSFVRVTDYEIKLYNVHDIIEDFVGGFFEHEMLLRNIEIKKEYDHDLTEVSIDNNQFRQVIINLLNNAADAIQPPGKITIKTSQDEKNVYIAIIDTGSGISQENIEKIFLPFYTTKPVGKGTGLGLSVSYGIIKNFGGKIDVKSILGEGTTFTISLHKN